MDEATLAFYQQLYAGTPLYVVPEPGTAAPAAAATPTPGPAPEAAAPRPAPATASVPAPAVASAGNSAATPPAASPPVAAAAPAPAVAPGPPPVAQAPDAGGPPKLPSLAELRAARLAATNPPASPPPPAAAPTPEPVPVAQPPVAAPAAQPPVSAPPVAPAPVVPQAAPTRQPVPFNTLGSNANGLVLLVRLENPEHLPRLQRNVFLNKMLMAIQRVMEECVIVDVRSPYPVSLEDLRARGLAVREVIGFGKNLLDVATKRTQPYEPVRIGDVAYLPAAEVEIIEYDNGRKKQLWQALQRMFLG